MNWNTIWIIWCVHFCNWVSVDFLNRLNIDPNLQPLYKKKSKIKDVWRSPSELQSNRCKLLYRVMAQASRGSDPLRQTWNQVPWASTKSSFIKCLHSDSPPHTLAGRRVPCGPCVRGDGMFLETERAYLFICNIVAILSIILLLYSLKFTFSILNLLEIRSIRSTTILGGKTTNIMLSTNVTCNGECETLVWSNSWEVTVMRV